MTDSKVVSLTGGLTGERKVSEALVAELRRLLEMAEAGECVAASISYTHKDGTSAFVNCGWVGSYTMLGALDCAKQLLLKRACEDVVEE